MTSLLMPREVDRLLRYPRGRSLKLARAGQLPHIRLPDGAIRFPEDDLERALAALTVDATSADAEMPAAAAAEVANG